jgi:hypothetical protein
MAQLGLEPPHFVIHFDAVVEGSAQAELMVLENESDSRRNEKERNVRKSMETA